MGVVDPINNLKSAMRGRQNTYPLSVKLINPSEITSSVLPSLSAWRAKLIMPQELEHRLISI
jgi:hypothetical protein